MRLKGKVALITGSSRGIGRAIAYELAKNGTSVVLTYKSDKDIALKTKEDIVSKLGVVCEVYKLDLNSCKNIQDFVTKISNRFGRLDILVNNASFYGRKSFFESNERLWEETFNVNLKGPYFLIKESEKIMKKFGGSIINISSDASFSAKKDVGIEYGISKAALNYLTKSLAVTLAPNIRVNAVAPGYTFTDMSGLKKDLKKKSHVESKIPLGRINYPEDIAKTVFFLVSDASKNITGEIISVNGGRILRS